MPPLDFLERIGLMCKTQCRLCDKLVISQSVTFADDTLVINLPAGGYTNGCKYCIVIAQSIPTTATITAPVVITIGSGTEQYPLNRSNCVQATACNIHTRTRYAVRVETSATSGVFRLLGRSCTACDTHLRSIDGTATTDDDTGGDT